MYVKMNELFILINEMNQARWKFMLGYSLLLGYI